MGWEYEQQEQRPVQGITQLYHDYATSIIRMHDRASTTANISRAAIEEQLLLELEKAVLPPPQSKLPGLPARQIEDKT